MNSSTPDLTPLLRRRSLADWLMVGFAILAFSWIPAGLILIFKDKDLRPVIYILWQLGPLLIIPLFGYGVCCLWRSSLDRKIRNIEHAAILP
jgi:hypothetical protein